MHIPFFKTDPFFEFLKDNGCKLITDEFASEDGFLVYQRKNLIVPVQIKKFYPPTLVCSICEEFQIEPPPVYEKIRDQLDNLRNRDTK